MKLEKRMVSLLLVIINFLFGKKVYGSKKAETGSSVSENFWKEHLLPITVPRYEFQSWSNWKTDNGSDYNWCIGIFLNDRYVLFHSSCFFRERHRLQEIEKLQFAYGSVMNSHQKPVLEDHLNPKIWTFGPITLYRQIDKPFKYNQQLRCINLPKAQELLLWKESYNIPNNAEVFSSRWCINKNINYYLAHLYLNGTRNCPNSIRYKTPRWLIPSCLLHKNPYKNCVFREGNSFVYNNTLLGIRNYVGETPPPPYNKIKYDLFLNLIPFVKIIQAHMQDYTPCPY